VSGIGDLGLALKLRTGVGESAALAVVPGATFPTGNQSLSLGAGRVLGSLVAIWSEDINTVFHTDINVGPVGIGAGEPVLFTSIGLSAALGRWGLAGESFQFTSGGVGPAQHGLLGAVLVTLAEWHGVGAGGVPNTCKSHGIGGNSSSVADGCVTREEPDRRWGIAGPTAG